MECIDFRAKGYDYIVDEITSARVWKTGGGYANGYWINSASGHSVEFTLSVGFSNSSS